MHVLFFGTYDAGAHPRVRVLAEGLTERGVPVHELNVPLGIDTGARVEALRRPSRLPALAGRVLRAWARLLWRSRRERRPDAVVVGYLGLLDVQLARLRWPGVPRVLDDLAPGEETAEDRGLAGGLGRRALRRLDRAALAASDTIVVDTPAHQALLPAAHRSRSVVVPVGAPRSWFRAPSPHRDGPLSVVFFGLYTPLQGATVIGEAIARLADAGCAVRFTMIGQGQDRAATRRAAGGRGTVRWLDWVEADRLPGLVADHDVCLGIFGTGQKARRVVPNKVYQGAAAGCAVVTSDTAPQRAALGEAASYVPAGDPAALTALLAKLAADPAAVLRARERAHERASAAFTPAAVVGPLHAHLDGTATGGRRRRGAR